MRTFGTILRILIGFAVACVVAGLVTAAFVITPTDISSLPPDQQTDRLSNAVALGLLAATHSAIFSFPFAFLAIAYAEWRSVRSWLYYAVAGIVIGLLGFGAEYLAEKGVVQPSILNDYAARAFLTVGFLGGLAYWLVSGRLAGSMPAAAVIVDDDDDDDDDDEDDRAKDRAKALAADEDDDDEVVPKKGNKPAPKVATAKR
jgi:hypothetical protein